MDLLPDREADSLAAWLRAHPGVEIISRDRAGAYADGARRGAPAAQQVADRFHIFKNLGDALEELLGRVVPTLALAVGSAPAPPAPLPVMLVARAAPAPAGVLAEPPSPDLPIGQVVPPRRRARDQERSQTRRARRLARYEEVRRLHATGWAASAIARSVGLDRGTVHSWIQSPTFPEQRARSRRPRQIDSYSAYLQQQWTAGCHNARQLWQEIRAQGYRGGYSQVAAYLTEVRAAAGIPLHKRVGAMVQRGRATAEPSARQLRWLLWRPVAAWTDDEYALVCHVERQSAEVTIAHGLVMDFQALLRERRPEELASWVQLALASGLPEVERFARGVLRDFAAVYAGMAGTWSNGPVEGHVNRLKMLKRQLFGRAKFDLLRLRVLHAT